MLHAVLSGSSLGMRLGDAYLPFITSIPNSFLDLGLPLWLGGVPSEFPLSPLHQISSRGVTGCIRNFYVNDRLLDLNGHLSQVNSASGCGQIEDVCAAETERCGMGGECLPRLEGYQCVCPPMREGQSCGEGNCTRIKAICLHSMTASVIYYWARNIFLAYSVPNFE